MKLMKEIYLDYKEDPSAPRTYTLSTADSQVYKTIFMADQPPPIRDASLYRIFM